MAERRHYKMAALLMQVLSALFSALALGALSALLAPTGSDWQQWLSFGIAIGMAGSMRFSFGRSSISAAILAALGTLLAIFYTGCLQAQLRLSAQLGLPFLEVIHNSGIIGTVQLGWLSVHPPAMPWYLAATLLSFALAWWWPQRKRVKP